MWSESINLFGLITLTVAQLVLVAVFAGLLIGYILAAATGRRPRAGGGAGPREMDRVASNAAFMKGINYILSDRHDRAIEELTKAVSVDTETVETYVALGNLFRRYGDIDRAIRIRQSIIVRPNLDAKVRRQALYDLGLDYHRGGFFERALEIFEEVLREDPGHVEAHQLLIEVHETTRDWEKAGRVATKLARLTGRKQANVLAHYQVEIAKEYVEKGRTDLARQYFKKALDLDPACVDAHLHLGDLEWREGRLKKALAAWRKVVERTPEMAFLTLNRLLRAAADQKNLNLVEAFLAECAELAREPMARLSLARLLLNQGKTDQALRGLQQALDMEPCLLEARREIGRIYLDLGLDSEALRAFRDFLDHLPVPESVFQCTRCGLESRELIWRCPSCYTWDAMALKRRRIVVYPSTETGPAASARPEAASTDQSPAA
ncbi:MAG: tetratricopeptide repeat protein [Thermodesulfobacteriota bacterium]